MPTTSKQQAQHTRRRIAKYISSLLGAHQRSLNSIGELIDVPASRIAEWRTGSRVITAETAFDLGDRLRSSFGWPTSGIEFLWAAGYWDKVLSVVKYLALDPTLGTDAAVMLYSWLPKRFIQFEVDEISTRLREKFEIEIAWPPDNVESPYNYSVQFSPAGAMKNALENDPGAGEAEQYFDATRHFSNADREEAYARLESDCSSDDFRERVARAWTRYCNAEFEGTPSLEDGSELEKPICHI
jgi:hypothetical protein